MYFVFSVALSTRFSTYVPFVESAIIFNARLQLHHYNFFAVSDKLVMTVYACVLMEPLQPMQTMVCTVVVGI
mgnify:CR=1 FL=1